MRIIDGFTFNDEYDMLELRLNELYAYVDRFILVESTKTFTGKAKPLYFAECRNRYKQFFDKIIHVIVDDMPETINPWEREYHQRNAIVRGLKDFDINDMIFISDVDEIMRGEVISHVRQAPCLYNAIRMPIFYFRFNYLNTTGEALSVWSIGTHGTVFTTPQSIRNLRVRMSSLHSPMPIPGLSIHDHGGWHFSYIGDESRVINKIESFSHQEFNKEEFKNGLDIQRIMDEGMDLFNRPGYKWTSVVLDDYFPSYLRSRQEQFSPYIIKNPKHRLAR